MWCAKIRVNTSITNNIFLLIVKLTHKINSGAFMFSTHYIKSTAKYDIYYKCFVKTVSSSLKLKVVIILLFIIYF